MGTLLQNLLEDARKAPGADAELFTPVARYYPAMDFLLYLNEDCSYRAERIDQFLTVLWHPYEEKLVGIKLKGFRFLFERIKTLLDLTDEQFLPLVKAIELALVGGVAESILDEQRQERLKYYDEAKKLAEGVSFDAREIKPAA